MTTALKGFIRQYVDISETDLEIIVGRFRHRALQEDDFVLTPGQVCQDIVFVENGCLRLYSVADDVETSVWFSFNHSSAIDIQSFISERPSQYFLQAIEPTDIVYLPKTELNQLYDTHPVMQTMMRKFWEDVVITLLPRFMSLQTQTAEQRYLDLLTKPEYLQRIPQKYLASFIGVTPTSLSRIRKNIR